MFSYVSYIYIYIYKDETRETDQFSDPRQLKFKLLHITVMVCKQL